MNAARRKILAAALLAGLAASPVAAQLTDEIPHASYYAASQAFYSGEYRDAERELRRESQRGVRTTTSRWIDSICYHAMLGEVLYHEGRNGDALGEFDQACQLLLAYPDWLLQVKFRDLHLRPDPLRGRRIPMWGRSERQFAIGQFANSEQIMTGRLDSAAQALQRGGGVVQMPMLWRMNIVEVTRMSALAIRRRNELLGPLAQHDAISRDLSATLARGNLAPPNHWSGAWIDLLRGLAQVGMGKNDEADTLIGRSLVMEGQFDHPLTCVGLMEQGRLAMVRGDSRSATRLLMEAGYSAYYFENWDVLTESILLGWQNHLASNGAGVYAPLEPVAAWAQLNRLQHLAVKLRLAQSESLLWLGQADAAAALVEETARRIGEMRAGLPGVHQLYVQAALQFVRGQLDAGANLLTQALAGQSGISIRNFQIGRTNGMYDSRAASPRVAVDLYAALLADPTPADWLYRPLDAMAVLQTVQDAAFDRWFTAALERKEAAHALDIAERTKRRRFLATRPFGGRIVALRKILEAPEPELSREAMLQRQQFFTTFPDYRTLADAGRQMADQLRGTPVLATDATEMKQLAPLYDNWQKNAAQRERLLAQFAVRRLPSVIEFPPLRTLPGLQAALGGSEALVEFHAVGEHLYGFLITKTESRIWELPNVRQLRSGLGDFLRALGNFGANREIAVAELASDKWRDAAEKTFAAVLGGARLDLDKTKSLIIVPDDLLWYMPFEALAVPGAKPPATLADRMTIRYGPTASLAIANRQPLRRPQHTGILANEVKLSNADADREAVLKELADVVSGPLLLPTSSPQPAPLLAALLDELVMLDDLAPNSVPTSSSSLLPRARGPAEKDAGAWLGLPYGGPEQIVLTGLATEAETGLKAAPRRPTTRSNTNRKANVVTGGPGSELFQTLCGLMADGARTILVTRWRTGGRTNFDLVREFAKELPQAPPAEAWQRACLLAREAPIDPAREPRLKRSDETGDPPTADHPFFWAGYLLVDTTPRPEEKVEKPAAAEKKDEKKTGEKGTVEPKPLPPPTNQQPPPPAVKPAADADKGAAADAAADKAK
jgi:hypothetical protein